MTDTKYSKIERKMAEAGVARPAIRGFLESVKKVAAGATGFLPEAEIEPVDSLPCLDSLEMSSDADLLNSLAVIKLNGGLGTGMGLSRAKSLIEIKEGATFLDFVAKQIIHLRAGNAAPRLSFYLMNSFSTQEDSLRFLRKYPELSTDGEIDFLQSKAPKLDANTLEPIDWPADRDLEWCPPGHGDIYPSLLGSGVLDRLLDRGVKFLFVSNSDNLGATVDTRVLNYFAASEHSFLMEVCQRTAADRKGGHLARSRETNRLLLRESAQCPAEDEESFQDVGRHRFFNTNNLWVRLDHLKEELERRDGAMPLALITNRKSVDPRDPQSPAVIQIETAMGAAIECFKDSGAIVVPRTRFAPVKSTADLLTLRSDTYKITEDFRIILDETRSGIPPVIDLDSDLYKLMAGFEACFANGIPSLIECNSLKVSGKFVFDPDVKCVGAVEFINEGDEEVRIVGKTYENSIMRFASS